MQSSVYNVDVMIISFVTQLIKKSTNVSLDVVVTFYEDILQDHLHHGAIISVTKWLGGIAFVVVKSFELEGNFPTSKLTSLNERYTKCDSYREIPTVTDLAGNLDF